MAGMVGLGDAERATATQAIRGLPATLRPKPRSARLLAGFSNNRMGIAGVLIVTAFLAVAVLAPVLAPPPDPAQPYQMPHDGYAPEPHAPSVAHPFGTSSGQYDIYYGVVWGTRTALKVGLVVTALVLLIGGLVGGAAAFVGGWVDEVVQRLVEITLVFPFFLAALTVATVLSPRLHDRLISALIALVAFGWPGYARLIRGDVLSTKARDYVLAARVIGVPEWQILLRHVLPNSIYSVLTVAWLDIAGYAVAYSGLSFLGLGPGVGYADWGQLLNLAYNWISDLATYWYILVYPGAALTLFTLGWNLIGDAFRDALDPRLRMRRGP
jgi:peptide/nickel transport system permease protein